jgi:hypothetical protein
MFRGVTDLNVNSLGNWGFLSGNSYHVFRPIGVCTTHGAFAPSYVPPLCAALSLQISHQDVFASRSVSLHGFCATDLPREPARHRDLSALAIAQLYRCPGQVELFFKWIKQHLRIKVFYGTTANTVKTQIWIAITIYVLVFIVKKHLKIEASLYTIQQFLSLTLFEKTPLNQLLNNTGLQMVMSENDNQLNLFN